MRKPAHLSHLGTRVHSTLAAAVAAIMLAGFALVFAPLPAATAADLSRFDPGYIISDQNFYDSGAMSTADVQVFLDRRGAACRTAPDGTPCLKDFRQNTPNRTADKQCPGGYAGRAGESAAEIIVNVAAGCGISPHVILVTLQKEQSLVTRVGPTPRSYQSAMGAGCPDTAACDALYYGFFNQVFHAAWLLKNYAVAPQPWHRQVGVVNRIAYHPPVADQPDCGAPGVLIRNQGTASLYDYTPYQPNAAALGAGYGLGDACSSYGNRNFWNYYTDWFGDPAGLRPIGSVDSLSSDNTTITVRGWALDPDTSASVEAHVYIDGAGGSTLAVASRPDLAGFGRGDQHGFTYTALATPGAHTVCTFAIASDPGAPTLLNCSVVVVPDVVPIGAVDSVTTTESSISVAGWTLDPDTSASNQAHLYVDGAGYPVVADISRPDVAAAYGRGDRHGFSFAVPATLGTHNLCVFGINTVAGPNTTLACRTVTVQASQARPFGVLDSVVPTPTGVNISGWTVDPDTTDPTDVHVYIDGTVTVIKANQPRADIGAAFGRGDLHGFASTTPLAPGAHSICVYAINTGPGVHSMLACRDFAIADAAPIGSVDSVVTAPGAVSISGWTLDPNTSAPIEAHVYIDGAGVAVAADGSRPDVAAAFGAGDRHGFTHTRALAAGAHSMCVYGISSSGGANTALLCQTFDIP